MARGVLTRALARWSPAAARVRAPASESWLRDAPHEVVAGPDGEVRILLGDDEVAVVAWAPEAERLPPGLGARAEAVDDAGDARIAAMSRAAAGALARGWAAHAAARGLRPPGLRLPQRVPLGDLLADVALPGLAAPLGVDENGPVPVDLVADGPHALVAGTTGSGKSELLVSWVLGMAAARSPDQLTLVLVDFKGGASFAPLATLPHVLGVVSDLDDRLARRAIDSLRAELRRRERMLADHGARAIEELSAGVLPRLVVVVDEFAAVVADHPDLHALFADLAARGRSLGIHLVLCTQRPAGVVRDGVLANVTLRVSLRVADRTDSRAVVGADAAADLPVDPPGRALLTRGDGALRMLQVAVASPADAERIAASAPPARHPAPWLPPLPERLDHAGLPVGRPGEAVFGRVDRPAEQSQPPAVWRPDRDGGLLVLGGRGSGRSTALAALAAGPGGRALPTDAVRLWRAVEAVRPGDGVLVVDDLDLALGDLDVEPRAALVARLERVARLDGVSLLAAARQPDGALRGLERAFPARLLLAQAGREDHATAGGPPGEWAPGRPPGSGWWHGEPVQVAIGAQVPARFPVPSPRVLAPETGRVLAVVTARPRDLAPRLRAAGVRVLTVGHDVAPDTEGRGVDGALRVGRGEPATVLLGDPDAWNADWAALAAARRAGGLLLVDVDAADARPLARVRELPPLDRSAGEAWWAEAGAVEPVRFEIPAPGEVAAAGD